MFLNKYNFLKTGNWKVIIDLIPVLTVFFSLIGIFKAIVYYHFFGINIIEYISFGEVVTLFLPDIAGLAIIFGVLIILDVYIFNYLKQASLDFKKKDDEDELEEVAKYFNQAKSIILYTCFIIILCIVSYYGYLIYNNLPHEEFVLSFYPYILFICGFLLIHAEAVKITKNVIDIRQYLNSLLINYLFFIYLLFLYMGLKQGVQKSEYPLKQQKTKVETGNWSFETSRDTIYLGRTNGFLFFFLKKENTSMILRSDFVNKISIEARYLVDTTRKHQQP